MVYVSGKPKRDACSHCIQWHTSLWLQGHRLTSGAGLGEWSAGSWPQWNAVTKAFNIPIASHPHKVNFFSATCLQIASLKHETHNTSSSLQTSLCSRPLGERLNQVTHQGRMLHTGCRTSESKFISSNRDYNILALVGSWAVAPSYSTSLLSHLEVSQDWYN